MKTKYLLLCMLVAALFTSCTDEYDDTQIKSDLADVTNRVESLEASIASLTSDISTIEKLVAALENNTYITSVVAVTNGYQINFSVGDSITIYNGTDGEDGATGATGSTGSTGSTGAPGATGAAGSVVGIAQDTTNEEDENYYWTINGSFITDESGNKFPVTVSATVIGVAQDEEDDNIYWTVDGEWLTYGDDDTKILAVTPTISIETSDDGEYVTITIGDDTYDVPVYSEPEEGISMTFEETILSLQGSSDSATLEVTFDGLTEANYLAMQAVVTDANDYSGSDIVISKAAATSSNWGVVITEPTFQDESVTASIEVAPYTSIAASTSAILKVSLFDADGNEYTKTAAISYKHEYSTTLGSNNSTQAISNLRTAISTALATEESPIYSIYYYNSDISSNQTISLGAAAEGTELSIEFENQISNRYSTGKDSYQWYTLTFEETNDVDFIGSLYITIPDSQPTNGSTANDRSNLEFNLPNAEVYFIGYANQITLTSGSLTFVRGTITTFYVWNGSTNSLTTATVGQTYTAGSAEE